MRDGATWEIAFEGGKVASKLKKTGTAGARTSGTIVRAWPDPKYFDTAKVKREDLETSLRAKAVLLPGLRVTLKDEAGVVEGRAGKQTVDRDWKYEGGLSAYLQERLEGSDGYVSPIFAGESYVGAGDDTFADGEGCAWAIAWA